MARIAFVYTEDWYGMYVDGVLEYEGHSMEPDQALDILGIPYDYDEVDYESVETNGFRLPKKLSDVKLKYSP